MSLLACRAPYATEGRSVVLVTLDTVRADHLGAYGHAEARTPVLDRIAEQGALFETALSVAPITLPTHASLLTGLYPYHHGARNNGTFTLSKDVETLAQRFRTAGYATEAIVSAAVLDSRYGLDRGFQRYDDDLYGGHDKLFMFQEVRADVSVDKALRRLEAADGPLFLWLHLFDAHADYEPPPPYDVLFRDSPYDGEIAWLDAQLGRLADALDPETLLVVTADHGDSLGEHGENTHGIFVYRSTTHVPLLVKGPGIPPARIGGVVSQVDVAPTLLALAGLPPLEEADGVDLAPVLARGASVPSRAGVYMESMNPRMHFGWKELRALDAGDRKVIDAPRPELYTDLPAELANTFDPGAPPPELATLRSWVEHDDLDALQRGPVDEQTREMLETLGYLADFGATPAERPDPKDVAHRWVDLQVCQQQVRDAHMDAAIACFDQVIAADPDNWAAQLSLVGALRRRGDHARSLVVLQGLEKRDPGDTKVLLNLAAAEEALGRPDDAEATLVRATTAAPSNPDAWNALGELRTRRGQHDAALDAFQAALKADTIFVPAYIGVANVFLATRRHDRALAYLEQALDIDPTSVTARYNLAVTADGAGSTARAMEQYREVLARDPGHALAANNLGSLLKREGRRDEAEALFRKALASDPVNVEARYNLATLLLEREPEKAEALLAGVVASRPDLQPARHDLAWLLERRGRTEEATVHWAWLARNGKDPATALVALARIQAPSDPVKARALLTRAIELGGDEARRQAAAEPRLAGLLP